MKNLTAKAERVMSIATVYVANRSRRNRALIRERKAMFRRDENLKSIAEQHGDADVTVSTVMEFAEMAVKANRMMKRAKYIAESCEARMKILTEDLEEILTPTPPPLDPRIPW